jgi:hypothetical protein
MASQYYKVTSYVGTPHRNAVEVTIPLVGPAGAQGATGAAGAAGAQGPIGNTGPSGEVGPQGPIGNTGATGVAGAKGDKGDTGDTGAQGATGPAGTTDFNDLSNKPTLGTAAAQDSTAFAAAVHTHAAADITSGTLDNARVNFAAPAAIGNTTPAAGNFTTLTANTSLAVAGGIITGASNVIEQVNSTSGQTFRLYNTQSGSGGVNFERLRFAWASNVAIIGTEKGGTGSVRNLDLQVDGNTLLSLGHSGGLRASGLVSYGQTSVPQVGLSSLGFFAGGANNSGAIEFYDGNGGGVSTRLGLDDYNVLAIRSGTSAQSFRIYNTTSWERANFRWASNEFIIDAEAGGTGTLRGIKLGSATSSLLGFFGVTPVDQPALTADLLDSLQEVGLVASGSGNTPLNLSGGTLTAGNLVLTDSTGSETATFDAQAKLTANRTYDLPDSSGTIALTSQSSDMEITDNTKGVILKSANNTRYRLTVSNSGLPIFTALLLFLLVSLAPAQNIGMATDTNGTILTDRTNVLTFTNPLQFNNSTNAATTISNLFSSNSLPSGASAAGSVLTSDGGGRSVFSDSVSRLLATNGGSATSVAFGILGNNTGFYGSVGGVIRMAVNGQQIANLFSQSGPNQGGFFLRSGSLAWLFNDGLVKLSYDAGTNILAQRNDESLSVGNEYRLYGSFTNSTNYRRLSVGHDSTNAFIRPESAGPLATNNIIHISGLPATNTGLASGVLWNSNGTVVVNP